MDRLQGQKSGYVYARYYAMALDALGSKAEAVRADLRNEVAKVRADSVGTAPFMELRNYVIEYSKSANQSLLNYEARLKKLEGR